MYFFHLPLLTQPSFPHKTIQFNPHLHIKMHFGLRFSAFSTVSTMLVPKLIDDTLLWNSQNIYISCDFLFTSSLTTNHFTLEAFFGKCAPVGGKKGALHRRTKKRNISTFDTTVRSTDSGRIELCRGAPKRFWVSTPSMLLDGRSHSKLPEKDYNPTVILKFLTEVIFLEVVCKLFTNYYLVFVL